MKKLLISLAIAGALTATSCDELNDALNDAVGGEDRSAGSCSFDINGLDLSSASGAVSDLLDLLGTDSSAVPSGEFSGTICIDLSKDVNDISSVTGEPVLNGICDLVDTTLGTVSDFVTASDSDSDCEVAERVGLCSGYVNAVVTDDIDFNMHVMSSSADDESASAGNNFLGELLCDPVISTAATDATYDEPEYDSNASATE